MGRYIGYAVNKLFIALLFATLFFYVPAVIADEPNFSTSMDVTIYRLASEQNDPSAQYLVGRNFFIGKTVEKNIEEAINWFEKAANQNHKKALYQLGKIYLSGEEVAQDSKRAYDYLSKAAQARHIDAQYELGKLLAEIEHRYEEAIKWFESAAKRDHIGAQFELGKILYQGLGGTTPNVQRGLSLLRMSAAGGDENAIQYINNIGNLPAVATSKPLPNPNTLDDSWKTLSTDDQFKLAMNYLEGVNQNRSPSHAAYILQAAAEKNHPQAQYQLARLYRDGIGVKVDENNAIYWFKSAATLGYQLAEDELNSLLIKKNLREANTVNASPIKQFSLGEQYLKGDGVEQDIDQAINWFTKAANNNYPLAQLKLGEIYKDALGVEKNISEARFWLNKAKKSGVLIAATLLEELENNHSHVSPIQITNLDENKSWRELDDEIHNANPQTQFDQRDIDDAVRSVNTNDRISSAETSDNISFNEALLSKQAKTIDAIPNISSSNTTDTSSNNTINNLGNDLENQYHLGLLYISGNQGNKDVNDGITLLKQAAKQNHVMSQYKLGELYYHGHNVSQNYQQAYEWLSLAANNGNPEAQLLLGDIYKKGKGIEKSNATAIKWYRAAANQGNREARNRLGGCRIC